MAGSRARIWSGSGSKARLSRAKATTSTRWREKAADSEGGDGLGADVLFTRSVCGSRLATRHTAYW